MSAELAARRTAAAAALADFGRWTRGEIIRGDWMVWSERLAAELRSLLGQLDAEQADETFTRPQPHPAVAEMAPIQMVLESFHFETDDAHYALEQICDVVDGRDR